MGVKLGLSD